MEQPAVQCQPSSLTSMLAEWASRLQYEQLPELICSYATAQVLSQLAVIRTASRHPLGRMLIRGFGPLTAEDPAGSAYLLAALSSCLYQEDSMYTGHVAHSTVNVPLAYRSSYRLDGRRLLAAVAAAGECAARIAAAATLGPMRGQGASYVQLVGAVAARCHCAQAEAQCWVNAWGLALGAPPWPLRRAVLGSDAKVLSAAIPLRTGLDACRAAEAGLAGAADILEHEHGFLAKFAAVPTPETVTLGLGRRWHTETLSIKLHPAGAYLDAAIDCAAELHASMSRTDIEGIREITVDTTQLAIRMDHETARYLDRARSSIMALNLSVGYNVATALITGDVTAADLAEPATNDPARWALADRVRLRHDPELSRRFLAGTAPLGEALRHAGRPARDWLGAFHSADLVAELADEPNPSETFESATKAAGATVRVLLANGRRLAATRYAAAGSAGPALRSSHRAMAAEKLAATGLPDGLVATLDQLADLDTDELDRTITAAVIL